MYRIKITNYSLKPRESIIRIYKKKNKIFLSLLTY